MEIPAKLLERVDLPADVEAAIRAAFDACAGYRMGLLAQGTCIGALLERVADGVLVQSPDLTILLANDWVRERAHCDCDPVGFPCHAVFFGRDHPCTDCQALASLEQGDVVRRHVCFETNGCRSWAEMSASAVVDEAGTHVATVQYGIDITERLLTQAHEVRAARSEATAQLAGGLAHRLNNLMVGVIGNAEMVADMAADDPEVQSLLHSVGTSAWRASDLARQLLDHAGTGSRRARPIDLNQLVAEHARRHRAALPEGTTCALDLADDLPLVVADPEQVERVLGALCINAGEALEGAGHIHAVTEVVDVNTGEARALDVDPGRYVRLSVSDDGCGMDESTRLRACEPFFSTKFIGRGLGLAAAQGIMRSCGGGIRIESQPGEGTTVEVLFPALS